MTRTKNLAAKVALAVLLPLVIAACGGGSGNSQEATQAAASEPSSGTARALAAQSTSAVAGTSATTLFVRAYGTVAGDVGPIMQVLVDGVMVGSTEVRAATPTEYPFATPTLKVGSKVDVVYTNDGGVNGVDRNLFVTQLRTANTYLVPNADNSLIDRGTGAGAFDGLSVFAGSGSLYLSSALRMTWPKANLNETMTVRASSTVVDATPAQLDLRVNGVVVGTAEVTSAEPTDFVFNIPALATDGRVDVAFTNAAPGRALRVHYLLKNSAVLIPSTAKNIFFDEGAGLAAYDSSNVSTAKETLTVNGALRAKWPAANMTDTLTIRTSGVAAGGIAPTMQVLLDGVVLGSVSVGPSLKDYQFAALPVQAGAKLEIRQTNPGTVSGVSRKLNVSYAINGITVMRPADAGVVSTETSVTGTWPQPNLTNRLTVRAKANLRGNVGPVMQVLIDDVLVGTAEVRATTYADFDFPAPAMQAGTKVEVVYTNDGDAGVAGAAGGDRNLYIDYLVSGTTYLRPNSSGVVYDRGAGASAFDNRDLLAGMSSMWWSGALRAAWPQPNITSTVTLRAAGTLVENVGPIVQLRVDGITVSTVEIRSNTLADYTLNTTPLIPGSKIDLVYTNGAATGTSERNLSVAYLLAGNTYVQPAMASVRYDRGVGSAALDALDVVAAQTTTSTAGALRATWPQPNLVNPITVRASASLLNNIGALMQVRVDGVVIGQVEVRSTSPQDYLFYAPNYNAGSRITVTYLNDQRTATEDRNLYVYLIAAQGRTLISTGANVLFDAGSGEAAYDGVGTTAGSMLMSSNGALQFTVPAASAADTTRPAKESAARFLQQAAFGGSMADIERVATITPAAWLTEQLNMPSSVSYVAAVQERYDRGDAWRPNGASYAPVWHAQRFWQAAATAPDVLRQRMVFALHSMLVISQSDSSLYPHQRAYASYLDLLGKNAFGNFRNLLEDIALSPAMGIYLSHMRNRPEDFVVGRMPDENFARELMQLFSIGLHELNIDGTARTDAQGNPIESYTIDDVMALAKVFTGYGWAFPDKDLTEATLRWSSPDLSAAKDTQIDIKPMKPYPGMHSTAEKRLFAGRSNALVIPANTSAVESRRMALDALFNHPNVGPFISRQLIQRMVTSNPSPAYVARVAAVFNNNGRGVRGDLAAVLRAVLLDSEASKPPAGSVGKLREPVLRVAHWMRAFGAQSTSGQWQVVYDLDNLNQRALHAPSVFGYFRPGYVPPGGALASSGITAPEMQIATEYTNSVWIGIAQRMAMGGMGWVGSIADVNVNLQPLVSLVSAGDLDGMIDRLNLLLFAGRMSASLKEDLTRAVTGVSGNDAASQLNRARLALFLSLASTEYLVQP